MDSQNWKDLSSVRLDKAKELLHDAKSLLDQESFMSANNRAFYSMEKCIKALLAIKNLDAKTHNGCLKLFNMNFVVNPEEVFTSDDYKRIERSERIRHTSDYDDFYIVNKREAEQQVADAEYFFNKVEERLKNEID
jgi:uncharacterized protein (UPF0332 family)